MKKSIFRFVHLSALLLALIAKVQAQHWPILGQVRMDEPYMLTPEICTDVDGGILVIGTDLSSEITLRKYGLGGDLLWARTLHNQEWMMIGQNIVRVSDGYIITGVISEGENDPDPDPLLIKLNHCLEFEWSWRLAISGPDYNAAWDVWEWSDSLLLVHTNNLQSTHQSFLLLNPYTGEYRSAYTLRSWMGTRFALDSGTAVFLGTAQVEVNNDGWLYDKLEVYPINAESQLQTKKVYYGNRSYPGSVYCDMERRDSGYMVLVEAYGLDSNTQKQYRWFQLVYLDREFDPVRFYSLTDSMPDGGEFYGRPFFLVPTDSGKVISISGQFGDVPSALWLHRIENTGIVSKDTLIPFSHFGYQPDPQGFDLYITTHTPLEDGAYLVGGAMRVGAGATRSFLLRFNSDLELDAGVADTNTYDWICTDTLKTGLLIIPEPGVIVLSPDSFALTPVDSQILVDPLSVRLIRQNNLKCRLYPNPAASQLFMDLPVGDYSINLMTADGRKIASWRSDGGQRNEVPVNGLMPGAYYLQLVSESGRESAAYMFILIAP